ncbi:MAG: class I SAM-dependent methyltransferase [bacterium]|nr:class I SAM-dependent methyltransferase [bacterium]
MKKWLARLWYKRTIGRLKNSRYKHLLLEVDSIKARRILEVGVYNGRNSKRMIRTAMMHHASSRIEYFGFDIFDQVTLEVAEKEKTADKMPLPMEQVRLQLTSTGANIYLFQGCSHESIPNFSKTEHALIPMDFIFIDGGHSEETIMADWKNLQSVIGEKTVVVFDDYYQESAQDGCRSLISSLDPEEYCTTILEPSQIFQKDTGPLVISFAKVTRV